MFQDVTLGSARFKAKRTKQVAEVFSQTVEIEMFDEEAQTDDATASASTQTGQEKQAPARGKGKDAASDTQEEDQRRVSECLQNVGGLMLREMAKNGHTSSCFSGLERYLEESEEKNVSKLFRLQFDYDTYFQPQQATATSNGAGAPSSLRLSCTGVSWNATGSVIAVAYGRFDHSGWCNYRSALCLWNVFQSDLNPQKPSLVLETSSGLMCVAFHPQSPSIVAAGSFNGEVFVWDTEPVDYRFFSSGIGDYFHREPVTKVAWVYDIQTNDYNVASVSGDGKILFWRVKDKLAFPVEGYVMHLPGANGGKSNNDETRSPVIGGKALAFSSIDKASRAFVVGSEGGVVARCFAKAASNVRSSDFKGEKKWTATAARLVMKLPASKVPAARRQVEAYASAKRSKEVTLATVYEARLDPATIFPSAMDFVFEPHTAPVYDASFSPFRKSLFLTASADGTTRVYSTLQRELLLSVDVTPSAAYLYAAEWSRTRPMVFAAASEDGNVYVFDLKVDRVSPVLIISGKDPTASAPMFALDFNPRQRNFLAAGDSAGTVHIWKLSWQLANFQTGENEMLEALELSS
ncbi:WD-40 domain-containing protein [Phytophthora sojae]|uniref:WD-40 domain-containing protein n=1 Tax=Phytophthora sojae (strain P6497) TaxID=1094619 RepID=G4Z490_PHYSP|nr:WD-40 domain-containing protein [Phytophthora sojae]EGZ19396.1 WD-40 domain-containing protein [Phytophthora sojae]|eukprot:XP_009522113.1 WD-40 domain-containing protein [Phytophthora sojae]